MFRKFSTVAIGLFLYTSLSAQQTSETGQTQIGQPAQPTPSIYNRMRRMPPSQIGTQNQQPAAQSQQPTTQSQQFPNPAQFPPEQPGARMTGQRPPITFPHATQPPQAQPTPQPAAPQPAVHPPVQQPPEVPSGLALKPANPPRISFAGGELTVKADNSTMADILSGIERATGAHLEGTQPDSERVFGTFGPGTPRQVLDSLLTGSRYDFILLDVVEEPGKLQRIILSQHGASALGNVAAANQPRPNPNQVREEEEEVAAPPPEPEPQPAVQPSPPEQQPQQQQPGTQQVKTPEQLLQELQRLRQQQQQENPPSPR